MYQVFFSERFKKDYRKLLKKNPQIKLKVAKQIKTLSGNPTHKSLRVHKISENIWSLSVDMSIRILFYIRGNIIFCTRIGTHDDVY